VGWASLGWAGVGWAGVQAGEQPQRGLVRRVGGGRVDLQGLVAVRHREHLVVQRYPADQRVVELLAPGGLLPHVVPGPQAAELGALDRQLADQRADRRVVRVPAGRRAQGGHDVPRVRRPVRVQLADARIQEHQQHHVAPAGRKQRRVDDQRAEAAVPGQ